MEARMYTLRDEKGVMKATLPDRMAEQIMMRDIGEMVEKNYSKGGKRMVWQLSTDNNSVITLPVKIGWCSQAEVKVYMWAGDTLSMDRD